MNAIETAREGFKALEQHVAWLQGELDRYDLQATKTRNALTAAGIGEMEQVGQTMQQRRVEPHERVALLAADRDRVVCDEAERKIGEQRAELVKLKEEIRKSHAELSRGGVEAFASKDGVVDRYLTLDERVALLGALLVESTAETCTAIDEAEQLRTRVAQQDEVIANFPAGEAERTAAAIEKATAKMHAHVAGVEQQIKAKGEELRRLTDVKDPEGHRQALAAKHAEISDLKAQLGIVKQELYRAQGELKEIRREGLATYETSRRERAERDLADARLQAKSAWQRNNQLEAQLAKLEGELRSTAARAEFNSFQAATAENLAKSAQRACETGTGVERAAVILRDLHRTDPGGAWRAAATEFEKVCAAQDAKIHALHRQVAELTAALKDSRAAQDVLADQAAHQTCEAAEQKIAELTLAVRETARDNGGLRVCVQERDALLQEADERIAKLQAALVTADETYEELAAVCNKGDADHAEAIRQREAQITGLQEALVASDSDIVAMLRTEGFAVERDALRREAQEVVHQLEQQLAPLAAALDEANQARKQQLEALGNVPAATRDAVSVAVAAAWDRVAVERDALRRALDTRDVQIRAMADRGGTTHLLGLLRDKEQEIAGLRQSSDNLAAKVHELSGELTESHKLRLVEVASAQSPVKMMAYQVAQENKRLDRVVDDLRTQRDAALGRCAELRDRVDEVLLERNHLLDELARIVPNVTTPQTVADEAAVRAAYLRQRNNLATGPCTGNLDPAAADNCACEVGADRGGYGTCPQCATPEAPEAPPELITDDDGLQDAGMSALVGLNAKFEQNCREPRAEDER